MEILLSVETKNLQKFKDMLLKDDLVSRASIVFKEGKALQAKEGYYCYISGLEEQCKKAKELAKDIAKEVVGEEKDKVIEKIKDEEQKAMKEFGSIFG
jgi:hypothetical protein